METKSLCFSDYIRTNQPLQMTLGSILCKKISQLREELDQGYVPNDQGYALDDSDVNSDSTSKSLFSSLHCIKRIDSTLIKHRQLKEINLHLEYS